MADGEKSANEAVCEFDGDRVKISGGGMWKSVVFGGKWGLKRG